MKEGKNNRWLDTVIYVYILKRSFTGIITCYALFLKSDWLVPLLFLLK